MSEKRHISLNKKKNTKEELNLPEKVIFMGFSFH